MFCNLEACFKFWLKVVEDEQGNRKLALSYARGYLQVLLAVVVRRNISNANVYLHHLQPLEVLGPTE